MTNSLPYGWLKWLGSPVPRLKRDQDWTGPRPPKTRNSQDCQRLQLQSGLQSLTISEIWRLTKDQSNWCQPVTSCVYVWLQVPNTNTTLLLPPPSPSLSPPFVTTASHHECLPWGKQHLGPHIDHHLMHWRLSNNTHMAMACHILHNDVPPCCCLSTLPMAATAPYCHQLPTPTLAHTHQPWWKQWVPAVSTVHGGDDMAPEQSPSDVPCCPDSSNSCCHHHPQ